MSNESAYKRVHRKMSEFRHHVRAFGPAQAVQYRLNRLRGVDPIPVRVAEVPFPLFCRPHDSDSQVFEQVFRDKECEMALVREPRLIIDAGANVGYSTVFFAAAYPNAKIIAIEPDPENCTLLRRHCAPFTNVVVRQAGLWSHACHLGVVNPGGPSWGIKVCEVPQDTPGAVQAITVAQILQESGCDQVDIFKIDIEGGEEQLFSDGYETWIDRVDVISVEVHSPEAEAALEAACAGHHYLRKRQGEKIIFQRTGRDDKVKS